MRITSTGGGVHRASACHGYGASSCRVRSAQRQWRNTSFNACRICGASLSRVHSASNSGGGHRDAVTRDVATSLLLTAAASSRDVAASLLFK